MKIKKTVKSRPDAVSTPQYVSVSFHRHCSHGSAAHVFKNPPQELHTRRAPFDDEYASGNHGSSPRQRNGFDRAYTDAHG